jgi:hypothetical protein
MLTLVAMQQADFPRSLALLLILSLILDGIINLKVSKVKGKGFHVFAPDPRP